LGEDRIDQEGENDLQDWLLRSRLNLLGALPAHAEDPEVQVALQLYLSHVADAVERLPALS
jgi:hypothetical protein